MVYCVLYRVFDTGCDARNLPVMTIFYPGVMRILGICYKNLISYLLC